MQTTLKLLLGSVLIILSNQVYAQCYILGDSIAQGVSKFSSECGSSTRVGLNTNDAKRYFTSKGYLYFDKVIISLGINDSGQATRTWKNLVAIRENMQANKIIWILPNMNYSEQNYLVKEIATKFGDSFLDVSPVIGKDKIHPTLNGYKVIANTLKTNI
jgi:lysophospholipase L1-like esterase